MKIILKLTSTVTIILISTLLIYNQFAMKSIKTEIIINASTERVWSTLMDHEEYPQWNPFIKQISGKAIVGEQLNVSLQNGKHNTMNFQPTILVNNSNNEFRWKGKLFVEGLFDGEHFFLLEDLGNGQTKFIQGEEFTGLLSGALLKIIGKDTKTGFVQMNEALKQITEVK